MLAVFLVLYDSVVCAVWWWVLVSIDHFGELLIVALFCLSRSVRLRLRLWQRRPMSSSLCEEIAPLTRWYDSHLCLLFHIYFSPTTSKLLSNFLLSRRPIFTLMSPYQMLAATSRGARALVVAGYLNYNQEVWVLLYLLHISIE